jgi:hypothetical protein
MKLQNIKNIPTANVEGKRVGCGNADRLTCAYAQLGSDSWRRQRTPQRTYDLDGTRHRIVVLTFK